MCDSVFILFSLYQCHSKTWNQSAQQNVFERWATNGTQADETSQTTTVLL